MIAYSIVSINRKSGAISHICGLMEAPDEATAQAALVYETPPDYSGEWTTPQIIVNDCIDDNLVCHNRGLYAVTGGKWGSQ